MSPGALDKGIIQRHLAAMDTALQQLEKHRGRSSSALSSNRDESWIVERGLQLCCQNALDVAAHLVARSGRDAGDYTEAIDVLAELSVIPKDFARSFRGIGGFRNALVHGYLTVDENTLHEVLNERLSEFVQFAVFVQEYLKEQGQGSDRTSPLREDSLG